MKPNLATVTLTVNLCEEGLDKGVNIFNITHLVSLDGAFHAPLAELLQEASDEAGKGKFIGWAFRQRLETLADEMENDPEQEAALTTLLGKAC
jgi:hypothetical protein